MTHAEHFLGRLDRLSARHTEEALLLYNDAPLLLSVLELARVPERVERVALALDEGGPYVLITRAGRFVTCLAAGMKIDDVPIVSRRQLDDFTGKVGELRARMELARSLVGTDRAGASKLVGRLGRAGADLSREEFAAIMLWQPMLIRELLQSLFAAVNFLGDMREHLVKTRLGKQSRTVERVLHEYWNAYWATGHISMMLASGDGDMFASLPPDLSEEIRTRFAWGTIRQGGIGLALRGAWAVGRLGKTMLPGARQWLRGAGSYTQFFTGALSLIALAMRHKSLRAEVLKLLSCELPSTAFPGATELQRAIYRATNDVLEQPEIALLATRAYAQASLTGRRKVRGLVPVDLPDSRLVPVVSLDINNISLDSLAAACLPAFLTQMARLSPEELYLPRAELDTYGYGLWTPEHSLVLVQPLTVRRAPAPAPAPPSVGRNDPCVCGSGKKSKKCCV